MVVMLGWESEHHTRSYIRHTCCILWLLVVRRRDKDPESHAQNVCGGLSRYRAPTKGILANQKSPLQKKQSEKLRAPFPSFAPRSATLPNQSTSIFVGRTSKGKVTNRGMILIAQHATNQSSRGCTRGRGGLVDRSIKAHTTRNKRGPEALEITARMNSNSVLLL